MKLESYLPKGTILNNGKYQILSLIGSGGFGYTYKAERIEDKKLVAVKELYVDNICNRDKDTIDVTVALTSKVALFEKLKNKFINEAITLCSYKHPHIVHAYEVFEENGTAYYSMDYIDGSPLSSVITSRGSLSETNTLHYFRHIAEALAYIHGQNRLHLDVKPSNIMIDNYGNAYLIDFGTSKQYNDETNDNTTTLLALSKHYSPAEQASQKVSIFSPEMDIYAFGATMYKALTGVTPPESVLLSSRVETLMPIPDTISPSVRHAVYVAMEVEASMRPQSIEDLWKIIDENNPVVGETTILEVLDEGLEEDVKPIYCSGGINLRSCNDQHKSVDLGLSVNWAEYNLGATRPEEFGSYFV